MARKTLKKKVQSKAPARKAATGSVIDSARDIWLAGLGAYALAQQEGGKLLQQGGEIVAKGNQLFEKLVTEGAKLERNTRDQAGALMAGIEKDLDSRVGSVRKQAADNWDKLENIFEDRVARVLGRLGVPTADDVNRLSARVQKLNEQVATLGAKAPARKAPARKAPARKAAAAN